MGSIADRLAFGMNRSGRVSARATAGAISRGTAFSNSRRRILTSLIRWFCFRFLLDVKGGGVGCEDFCKLASDQGHLPKTVDTRRTDAEILPDELTSSIPTTAIHSWHRLEILQVARHQTWRCKRWLDQHSGNTRTEGPLQQG